jgi:hypothetical protein
VPSYAAIVTIVSTIFLPDLADLDRDADVRDLNTSA